MGPGGREVRTSEIGNQEIWNLEIARILHLRAEIINLRLDRAEFNVMTASLDSSAQLARLAAVHQKTNELQSSLPENAAISTENGRLSGQRKCGGVY